jgi:hypothetical protein
LCATGFAAATAEHVVAGNRDLEVARLRITEVGRRALGNIKDQDAST